MQSIFWGLYVQYVHSAIIIEIKIFLLVGASWFIHQFKLAFTFRRAPAWVTSNLYLFLEIKVLYVFLYFFIYSNKLYMFYINSATDFFCKGSFTPVVGGQ